MGSPGTYVDVPLSIAHLCELDTPPLDLLACAGQAGFASIGIRTAAASPGGIEYPLRTAAEQAAVRRRKADTGVEILYIELISLSEATRAEDHKAMLEAGAEIGATRLTVAADSPDLELVADRLAAICEIARPCSIAVDFEFMPFRAVKTLKDAIEVVRKAGQPNAHVLVDTLHVYRSGSALADFKGLDPALIGTIQICDAPKSAPPPGELVTEARTRRLIPGHGGLDLWAVMDALPLGVPIGVEVPMASLFPDLSPTQRLTRLATETRTFLNRRTQT